MVSRSGLFRRRINALAAVERLLRRFRSGSRKHQPNREYTFGPKDAHRRERRPAARSLAPGWQSSGHCLPAREQRLTPDQFLGGYARPRPCIGLHWCGWSLSSRRPWPDGENFILNAVGEKGVLFFFTQVFERQHGDALFRDR